MTYREQFDSAMKCQTKEEAEAWMVSEVYRYAKEYGKSPYEAGDIIRVNLGYMAGYCDHEVAQKISHLFGASHPVFGSADYHQTMTAAKCLEAGKVARRESETGGKR